MKVDVKVATQIFPNFKFKEEYVTLKSKDSELKLKFTVKNGKVTNY